MIFYLIGIDYRTAKLERREEASLLKKNFIQFLGSGGMHNARLFSTCNRFEIYDFAKDNDEVYHRLNILKGSFNYLLGDNYTFIGEKEVFSHLLRLGCGLESQVKAESQILEQLINFSSQKNFPENLKIIFDKAIFAARFIRAKAGLDKKIYNIADLVLEDIIEKTNSVRLLKIVVVGTGKIAELFASIRTQGVRLYFLAHKNYIKAIELAKKAEGRAFSLDKIDEIITDIDVLISATKSPHHILTEDFFRKVVVRRNRPLYVYDLAIPRDIDPKAAGVKGIILKNMEDLSPIFEKHNKKVENDLLVLEKFAQEQAEKYEEPFDGKNIENRHTAECFSIKTS